MYQALLAKRIVNTRDIDDVNDFKELQIGWVFDINFKPTRDALISRGYVESIVSVLPASKSAETQIDQCTRCAVERYGVF